MQKIAVFSLFFWISIRLFSQNINHWETVVYTTDLWRYTTSSANPGTTWNKPSFNDSGWNTGIGGIGYGDGDDNTVIATTTTVFMRIHFNIADLSKIEMALLDMDYDDAFVAYINGVEVARAGITGTPPAYNQLADAGHEATMYSVGTPTSFTISKTVLQSVMVNGDNLLAIEVHNDKATSSDLSAIAYLSLGINDQSSAYRSTPSWFQPPFVFSSSNIPIVVIETLNNDNIVNEPKMKANMKVIRNVGLNFVSDSGNNYNGNIGIEIRGSYSASLPQKSYGLETRDSLEQNLNVKILGMPKENDWILLANYNDKSFMRNPLSYYLFRKMGHYAARFRHCEVMINGNYQGIYIFTERIKQDDKRVDIAKLDTDDNAGDSLTGGYIFKIDYYTSADSWLSSYHPIDKPSAQVHFVYHDPKPEDLTAEQKLYLQTYVNSVEAVLYSAVYNDPVNGYAKYLDVNSFIDYFIIGELSRNADAYKKSRYFFKDKDSKGGLISSGPVWDFDWAYKNMNDCSIFKNTDGSGWAYKINSTCSVSPSPDGWIVRMMQDPAFQTQLGNRYHSLRRSYMSNDHIHHFMDSIATVCSEAQVRHYKKWPILGKNVGAPEVDAIPTTYEGEVHKLRSWIDLRLAWLDANMPAETATGMDHQAMTEPRVKLFPNPAVDFAYIESEVPVEKVEIYTLSGNMVYQLYLKNQTQKIDLSMLKEGVYLLNVTTTDQRMWRTKLLINK